MSHDALNDDQFGDYLKGRDLDAKMTQRTVGGGLELLSTLSADRPTRVKRSKVMDKRLAVYNAQRLGGTHLN